LGIPRESAIALLGISALPDATPLALRINSPGGSVFDAVAIYNAIKRHSGAVTVWIDGIAASAASYIAMAGDEVVMPENAFLMIHDPSGIVMGTAEDMRAMAEALDKMKGSLLQGYVAKSGRPPEEIALLMAAETWLDAKDALDFGFVDRIDEPLRIAARFDVGRFRNAPPRLVEAAADGRDTAAGDAEGGETTADIAGEAFAADPAAGNANPEPVRASDLAAAGADADAGEYPSMVPDPACDPDVETLGACETFDADAGPPVNAGPPHEDACTVAAANGAENGSAKVSHGSGVIISLRAT